MFDMKSDYKLTSKSVSHQQDSSERFTDFHEGLVHLVLPVWEAKAILCSQVSGSEFVHQNGSLMRNRYRAELLDSTTYSHEIALSPRCRLPPMSWLSAYLEPLCTLSNTYIFHRWEWYPRIILSWRMHTLNVSESWNWIILFHEILMVVLMIF